MRLLWIACSIMLACRASGTASTSSVAAETFHGRGKLVSVSAKSLDIHHESMPAVRGFDGKLAPMMSMTMPFATSATASASGLAIDDLVSFDFTVHYDSDPTLRLVHVEKLLPGTKLDLK